MNSDRLYQRFREHYDELFINSDLVLSLPYSISLFWGTASVFGGPIMNQAIPHRGYIGFRKNKTGEGIRLASYRRMSFKTGCMEQSKDDTFYAPDDSFFKELSASFPGMDMDVFILTEFETRNADVISGGLILWLDMFTGEIDDVIVDFLKKSHCRDLYANEYMTSLLRRVLSLRMNYNKLTIGGSSLDAFMSGLIDSELPILHMQEKNFYPTEGETVEKKVILKKVDDFWPLYVTKRTEELMNADFNRELPFDIMMFSLGDYRNIGWYQAFLNWGENSEHMKSLLLAGNESNIDSFFLQPLEKNHLLYKTIEIISSYVFHLTKIFLDTLLAKEKVDTLFFYLKRNIEIINTLLGKYNLSSHEWEDSDVEGLKGLLNLLYPNINPNDYFIYTTGSSIELKYVVLFPKYLPKFTQEQISLELQKCFQKNVSLIYSSKNDGFAHEGLRVEQFVSKQMYSKYLGDKNIILRDCHNGSMALFGNQEAALERAHKGMCIDTINKKILINWEKLSSKDLLSQNATVDILSMLLENIGKEMPNSSLAKSGYSQNKNEMTGKIILPLLKLVEERMGKSFPLVCKGNIQEFYLKLEKPDIGIFLLQKR